MPTSSDGRTITVEEFDRMFDNGEDITAYLDQSSLRRPGLDPRQLKLPAWVVERIDREAQRRGVTREPAEGGRLEPDVQAGLFEDGVGAVTGHDPSIDDYRTIGKRTSPNLVIALASANENAAMLA